MTHVASSPTSVTKNSSFPPALFQGTLNKVGGSVKTWKTRYFRMYPTQLHYYENELAALPKGSVLLPGAQLAIYSDDVYPNHPFSFGITPCNNQRDYVFSASSASERVAWIAALKPLCQMTIKTAQTSIKEGYMTKQGGTIKTWKRRWFVLTTFPSQLQYFKDVQATSQSEMIDFLDLSANFQLETEKGSGGEWVFAVKPMSSSKGTKNDRVYKFSCASESERESWLSALRGIRLLNQ